MEARPRQPEEADGGDRSEDDVELDVEVALRVEEYRWVEWNNAALRDAPLYAPGRFIGHSGDFLSHLYLEASEGTPLARKPYLRLPRYSAEPGPALRAAERAGVFRHGGAVLSCTPGGTWHLSAEHLGGEMADDRLPRLLCLAALRLVNGWG